MPSEGGTTHIVGAGVAGLAAAIALAAAGRRVVVHEAGPSAGGRCRSYFDRTLGLSIDNGNHLLLSGNRATMGFLTRIGARDRLSGPGEALFPFLDLATGERWSVRPNAGRVPWWLFCRDRRVPGARLAEFLPLLALHKAPAAATVAEMLRRGELRRRLLDPLAIAALNTLPEEGSARLLGAVVQETLALGGAACQPLWPHQGLSHAFIEPALAWLTARGASVHFSRRVTRLELAGGRVGALLTPEGAVELGPDADLVLAVPATTAGDLLPGLVVPDAFEAIINIHYKSEAPPGFIGLIGGTAEWVFAKQGHLSVTISAGNRFVADDPEALATRVWPEVRAALRLPEAPMPVWRVVKEKRATFAATPAQQVRRPKTGAAAGLGVGNLALAGDYTATGLPATIEGAIRSGNKAAEFLLDPPRRQNAA